MERRTIKKLTALMYIASISSVFTLAACGPQSGGSDTEDYEVIFYTPKGDTAVLIITEEGPSATSSWVKATDKKTGKTVVATPGTTVISKPIPAIK